MGEWRLPPGTRVVTGIVPLYEDGRFHEGAERFDPDRYVGGKPDTYAWIPFGGGLRRCLGAAVVRRRRSDDDQAAGRPESTSFITALNSAETRSSSSPRTSARTSV